jgi:predicted RNase H-like nuclease (RuvC/YqgF family)
MQTEKKYTEIINEVVRNEAVSHDKLKMLAKKNTADTRKIQWMLRKVGVIEGMGKGVNRVLIRGQEVGPYVEKVLEMTKKGYKKKGKPDADNKLKDFMDAVQKNTNKQNEYIAALDRRIEKLEKRIDVLHQNIRVMQDIYSGHKAEIENSINDDDLADLRKRIEKLENHDQADKLAAMQVRLEAQLTHICEAEKRYHDIEKMIYGTGMDIPDTGQRSGNNGGVLKALHQLLGEIV